MHEERSFNPLELSSQGNGVQVALPVEFLQDLSAAPSLQNVLDIVSQWIYKLFDADRASITLQDGSEFLKLYSISGNKAIPLEYSIPISETFVGRAYSQRKLIICDDTTLSDEHDCVMLASSGLRTCMDSPLLSGDTCFGTLNVAHKEAHYYTEHQAVQLQCLANWIALNIQLRLQVTELNKLALIDHLTGIANRRAFTQNIQRYIRQFHAEDKIFYLGLLDVDHFKKLNDTYGHNTGDYVLRQIVTIADSLLGEAGDIFRIGGEEFAIIINVKNEQAVIKLFQSIKEVIANTSITYEQSQISTSVSIGITHIGNYDYEPEALLRRSDIALYQAKSAGRNRIDMLKPNVAPE